MKLTRSERRILAKLAESRPDVVTREELMMDLWNTDEYVSDGTLTTVICRQVAMELPVSTKTVLMIHHRDFNGDAVF